MSDTLHALSDDERLAESREEIRALIALSESGEGVPDAVVLAYDLSEAEARYKGSLALHLHLLSSGIDQKDYAASHKLTEPTVSRRNTAGRYLRRVGADAYTPEVGAAASRMTMTPGADSEKRRVALFEAASAETGIPSDTNEPERFATLLLTAARIVTERTAQERADEKVQREADRKAAEEAQAAAEAEAAQPVTVEALVANASKILTPVVRSVESGTITPEDLEVFAAFVQRLANVTRTLLVERGVTEKPKPAAKKAAAAQ